MDMAALVFQPHLKTRRGTLRRKPFLGCDRNHNSVDCPLLFPGRAARPAQLKKLAVTGQLWIS
jgi:hypothetical protein